MLLAFGPAIAFEAQPVTTKTETDFLSIDIQVRPRLAGVIVRRIFAARSEENGGEECNRCGCQIARERFQHGSVGGVHVIQ